MDPSGALVPQAAVTVTNAATGFTAKQHSSAAGAYRFSYLPVGNYSLQVSVKDFSRYDARDIRIDVNRIVNLPVTLALPGSVATVDISATAASVDMSSTLGNVISAHDAVDLPLNGRNITQLGLLQPGVAPLTFGLQQAGGIARANQAYAVNGQPPESNNYLLDGVSNLDSVNGGFAIRMPPDAVAEFRILTSNAPPNMAKPAARPPPSSRAPAPIVPRRPLRFSRAITPSTRATSSPPPLNRCIRINSAQPSAAPSATTKISSSRTTKASATARAKPAPPSCPPPRSAPATSPACAIATAIPNR